MHPVPRTYFCQTSDTVCVRVRVYKTFSAQGAVELVCKDSRLLANST